MTGIRPFRSLVAGMSPIVDAGPVQVVRVLLSSSGRAVTHGGEVVQPLTVATALAPCGARPSRLVVPPAACTTLAAVAALPRGAAAALGGVHAVRGSLGAPAGAQRGHRAQRNEKIIKDLPFSLKHFVEFLSLDDLIHLSDGETLQSGQDRPPPKLVGSTSSPRRTFPTSP